MAVSKDFIKLNPSFNLLETGIASFSGTDSKSLTIEIAAYTNNEVYVVLTPTDNVNVNVANLTKSTFDIEVSQENYNGDVNYHIYRADL